MVKTSEDEFSDALEGLIRLAERYGLGRERDCLKSLQLARSRDYGDGRKAREMAAACVADLEISNQSRFVPDPAFPSPGWTGVQKGAKTA